MLCGITLGAVYGRGSLGAIYSQDFIPPLRAMLGASLSTPGFNALAVGSYF